MLCFDEGTCEKGNKWIRTPRGEFVTGESSYLTLERTRVVRGFFLRLKHFLSDSCLNQTIGRRIRRHRLNFAGLCLPFCDQPIAELGIDDKQEDDNTHDDITNKQEGGHVSLSSTHPTNLFPH